MAPEDKEPLGKDELRRRAEARLKTTREDVAHMAPKDVQTLVEELQVHQVELEMQNEELRQSQNALADARDRYRALYEFAPAGYVTLDGDRRIEQINLAAAEMLGEQRASLQGQRLAFWLDGAGQEAYHRHLRAVDRGEGQQSWEVLFHAVGGRRLYCQCDACLREDGPHGYWVTLTDITQRKEAEEALARSEALHRTMAANLPGGAVFMLDAGLRYALAEGEALKAAGFAPSDFEGKTIWEALEPATAGMYEPYFRQALAGQAFSMEHESHGRHYVSHGTPIADENGAITHILVSSYDITGRRHTEQALEDERNLLAGIVENIPVMLVIWEPSLQRFSFNSEVTRVLGWTEEDANQGDWMTKVYPDPAYRREIAAFMRESQGAWRDIQTTAKDGSAIDCSWANIVLPDGRHIGIGLDMRDRKAMEDALRDLNATLEERVAERTALANERARKLQAMAAMLSEVEEKQRARVAEFLHEDLQQILVSARMQAGRLGTAGDLPARVGDVRQELSGLIDQAVSRCRLLAHDLIPQTPAAGDFRQAIQEVAGDCKSRYGLDVKLDAQGPIDDVSQHLQGVLLRALRELLFNVVKHADAEEATVELRRDGEFIEVTVRDHGRGFDPAALPTAVTDKGMGLFGMRQRVEMLGGELDIESAPGGGGCVVKIRVPVLAGDQER